AFGERRRPDQVGEDDRDDLARAGVLGRAGGERGAAGVAELGLGSTLTPTRRAARCERPAAAVAEPCTRPVRFPTVRARHGETPSTPASPRARFTSVECTTSPPRARHGAPWPEGDANGYGCSRSGGITWSRGLNDYARADRASGTSMQVHRQPNTIAARRSETRPLSGRS